MCVACALAYETLVGPVRKWYSSGSNLAGLNIEGRYALRLRLSARYRDRLGRVAGLKQFVAHVLLLLCLLLGLLILQSLLT
ncbi:hypothetical protein MycrhDRAFT_0390 [Mycolicibacterium rhodesiae JS60]|nr:hypothetical protein MycrhDRAFT_0390 [Mycolicibacterium rhodesiae JS60]